MASFLRIFEHAHDEIVAYYFAKTREAEEHRRDELSSSIRIQSWIRGCLARKRLKRLASNVLAIQRLFRGFIDRREVAEMRQLRKIERRRHLFDEAATLIQKIFRGHCSRATRVDFYKRKRYIEEVSSKSQKLCASLEAEFQRQIQDQEDREELEAAMEFEKVTENLHHLLSTSAISGIFRSPYGEAYSATAFDIPVEQHIHDSFKSRFERKKEEKEKQLQRTKQQQQQQKKKTRKQKLINSHSSKPRTFRKPSSSTRKIQKGSSAADHKVVAKLNSCSKAGPGSAAHTLGEYLD